MMKNFPRKTSERAERAQQTIYDEFQVLIDLGYGDMVCHVLTQASQEWIKTFLTEEALSRDLSVNEADQKTH
jgi:hypothetical protein